MAESEQDEKHRRWERLAPAHTVAVAAEAEGAAVVSGEALNLSTGGACLALQTPDLSVGDEVILWMRFAERVQPVPATGRIVWSGGRWGRPRYGVEWTHFGPQRSWIGWLVRA